VAFVVEHRIVPEAVGLVDGGGRSGAPSSGGDPPVVGVDVTAGRSVTADDVARPASVWRWLWSGQWRKGPPIVSVLMRAATVSTGADLAAARAATDVLVLPDVSKTEIRDWSAYEPAVAEGHRAMAEALDRLDRPVPELRRRPSLQEARRPAPLAAGAAAAAAAAAARG